MKNTLLFLLGSFWVYIFISLVLQGVEPREVDAKNSHPQKIETQRQGGVTETIVTDNTEKRDVVREIVVEKESPSQQNTPLQPNMPKKNVANNRAKVDKQNSTVVRIEVFPQKTTLKPGGSDVFTALGYNAQGQQISFVGKWSTNAGTIERIAQGKIKLTAHHMPQTTCWLRCTDQVTHIHRDAFIDIAEVPRLVRFAIEGLPSAMHCGDHCELRVVAYDQFGNHFPIDPEWQTPAGVIAANGHFVAGKSYGQHKITLRDRNSGQTISRSIYINPRLEVIDLYGTEKSLRPGEKFQYHARCYDRYRNEINFPLKWWASGGEVDDNGYLTPGEIPGTYEIFVQGIGTDIRVGMYYKIVPIVKSIEIVNIPEYIYSGDCHVFRAIAYDYRNRPLYFEPIWKAEGGQINVKGEFHAGNQPGTYTLTVADGYGVQARASFVIKAEVTEKVFPLTGDVLFEKGEKVVRIQHAEVTIFKTGKFLISYRAQVFQKKRWNYRLRFFLKNRNFFYVHPAAVKKSPGHYNFTQRGRSQDIRRTFRNIQNVDGQLR